MPNAGRRSQLTERFDLAVGLGLHAVISLRAEVILSRAERGAMEITYEERE